jgi:hypothetical protein
MPSQDEIKDCLQKHLSYEIEMLRVAAMRLTKIKGPETRVIRGHQSSWSIEMILAFGGMTMAGPVLSPLGRGS